jgi:hypothetical protein
VRLETFKLLNFYEGKNKINFYYNLGKKILLIDQRKNLYLTKELLSLVTF